MQTDVLDYNNIENIMTADIVHSDVLLALQNEIQNMNLGIKINVQLLSRKNMLQFKRYLKELASLIQDRLSDAEKEVTETELYELIERILFPILHTENDKLFHLEYDLLNSTNDILKGRLEQTLYEKSYQDCLLAMNEIIEQFRVGVHNTNYIIDLEKKVDSLTYELAMTYKLHSSIELYMDIKKLVEEYKVEFHEVYSSSLKQLQEDNFNNAIKVKDSVSHKMQERRYRECKENENNRNDHSFDVSNEKDLNRLQETIPYSNETANHVYHSLQETVQQSNQVANHINYLSHESLHQEYDDNESKRTI